MSGGPAYDVVVVGGGPVGLAAGVEARLAGLSAAVVEQRRGSVDKACGEGLMPGAVAALDRLDVRPEGHRLAGIAYIDGRRRAEHRFARRCGLGVRRTTLHAALAARAAELGVVVLHDRVQRVDQDPEGVTVRCRHATGVDADLRATWVLACDGLHSGIRRQLGLDHRPDDPRVKAERRRFGLRRHFRVAPWGDLVEVHWGERVEAYVTPVADDLVGVALLGPPGTDFDAGVATLPELAARLHGAQPDGQVRGAGPLRQRTTARVAGRVLLVGDASGYVDALTGEGIRVGLAQAAAAVGCVREGRPRRYEPAWTSSTRDFRVLTGGLVAAATSPLRPAIVPAAAALPRLYGAVVERLAR